MHDFIDAYLAESTAALTAFQAHGVSRTVMAQVAARITTALRAGGKLMVAGNGGSAADAQHMAGEIVGRLFYDRGALAALALTTDSSVLTATSNDYGYEQVFARQVQGLGQPGDVLIGISTSGTAASVLNALAAARHKRVVPIGFTGASGGAPDGPMAASCDLVLAAPSTRTSVIQQIHIVAIHIICGLVERDMFPRP